MFKLVDGLRAALRTRPRGAPVATSRGRCTGSRRRTRRRSASISSSTTSARHSERACIETFGRRAGRALAALRRALHTQGRELVRELAQRRRDRSEPHCPPVPRQSAGSSTSPCRVARFARVATFAGGPIRWRFRRGRSPHVPLRRAHFHAVGALIDVEPAWCRFVTASVSAATPTGTRSRRGRPTPPGRRRPSRSRRRRRTPPSPTGTPRRSRPRSRGRAGRRSAS